MLFALSRYVDFRVVASPHFSTGANDDAFPGLSLIEEPEEEDEEEETDEFPSVFATPAKKPKPKGN